MGQSTSRVPGNSRTMLFGKDTCIGHQNCTSLLHGPCIQATSQALATYTVEHLSRPQMKWCLSLATGTNGFVYLLCTNNCQAGSTNWLQAQPQQQPVLSSLFHVPCVSLIA
jgi:hypothetical protein